MGELLHFDPERLALHPGEAGKLERAHQAKAQRRKRPRFQPEAYAQVPLDWFYAAARAMPRSPAALATGTLLYRAAMMQHTRTPRMPTKALREAGVSLDARRRALEALEAAGLVGLEPRPNKSPRVTIRCPWLEEYLGTGGGAGDNK
jgi:hypothetical protein